MAAMTDSRDDLDVLVRLERAAADRTDPPRQVVMGRSAWDAATAAGAGLKVATKRAPTEDERKDFEFGYRMADAIAARFIWVFPATYLPRWFSARLRERRPARPLASLSMSMLWRQYPDRSSTLKDRHA